MDVLRKIKGATLMETLVATVLVVVVFMMASLILNNTFSNYIKNNKHQLYNYLHELEYLYISEKIELPYDSDYKDWSISIIKEDKSSKEATISATQNKTDKQINYIINEN